MTLFFSLLPLYLFGNLHCMGMCGPLVMLLGQHRSRLFYFLGRVFSFSLAGLIAGELGAVLHLLLKKVYLSESASLLSGLFMMGWGLQKLNIRHKKKTISSSPHFLNRLHQWLSSFLFKDSKWNSFLLGFFTLALPCGQTLIVFSACALAGDPWIGLLNGFAFALLTSPSLMLAMHALTLFKNSKHYDKAIIGGSSMLVGLLACCRGLAELGWIPHFILNPWTSTHYHIVIF